MNNLSFYILGVGLDRTIYWTKNVENIDNSSWEKDITSYQKYNFVTKSLGDQHAPLKGRLLSFTPRFPGGKFLFKIPDHTLTIHTEDDIFESAIGFYQDYLYISLVNDGFIVKTYGVKVSTTGTLFDTGTNNATVRFGAIRFEIPNEGIDFDEVLVSFDFNSWSHSSDGGQTKITLLNDIRTQILHLS